MLLATVVLLLTLADYDGYPSAFKSVQALLVIAAVVALLAGWPRPAPWLLALASLFLLVTWSFAFVRWLRQGSLINERQAE
jgi:hypothetical protein